MGSKIRPPALDGHATTSPAARPLAGTQIASYLARVHSKSMPRALEMFTKARPPGIYKHYYIRWAARGGGWGQEEEGGIVGYLVIGIIQQSLWLMIGLSLWACCSPAAALPSTPPRPASPPAHPQCPLLPQRAVQVLPRAAARRLPLPCPAGVEGGRLAGA